MVHHEIVNVYGLQTFVKGPRESSSQSILRVKESNVPWVWHELLSLNVVLEEFASVIIETIKKSL